MKRSYDINMFDFFVNVNVMFAFWCSLNGVR
jgi:hypothetical protein